MNAERAISELTYYTDRIFKGRPVSHDGSGTDPVSRHQFEDGLVDLSRHPEIVSVHDDRLRIVIHLGSYGPDLRRHLVGNVTPGAAGTPSRNRVAVPFSTYGFRERSI